MLLIQVQADSAIRLSIGRIAINTAASSSTEHHLVKTTNIGLTHLESSISETAVHSRTSTIPDNGSVRAEDLPELYVMDTTTSLTHSPTIAKSVRPNNGLRDLVPHIPLVSDVSRIAENVSIRTTTPAGGSFETI
ncbi:hypothetical protein KVT40_000561 [Elsinoe batatas]|uniref:Uncharacterized protein n=1 Tax=Elsinoe batatas TaxID=2601811 RepID=A0A8K0L7J7_9PEZI|nr:hypothetical protein KVT40_000561 [Elsinoe batatas]